MTPMMVQYLEIKNKYKDYTAAGQQNTTTKQQNGRPQETSKPPKTDKTHTPPKLIASCANRKTSKLVASRANSKKKPVERTDYATNFYYS